MYKQIKQRFKLPSPDFWKKIGNGCLIVGAIIGVIGGGLVTFYPTLGTIVITIGATIAAVGKILAGMTVENPKLLK